MLQLADSAFPTGGFAHSWGLEAAWQTGEVTAAAALEAFVRESLWQVGYSVLPLASAAHREPDRLEALGELCDAFLINEVANRASRAQGRAFVGSCARIWPTAVLVDLDRRARNTAAHYAPAAGASLRALHVTLPMTQRLFLFSSMRGLFAAAVRLGIVGSYEAQGMQSACERHLDRVLAECAGLGESDVAQTAPLIDLFQASHDRLYSRLFQS